MNQSIPADSLITDSWESECIQKAINELKRIPSLHFTITFHSLNLNGNGGNRNGSKNKSRKRKIKTDEIEQNKNDTGLTQKDKNDNGHYKKKRGSVLGENVNDSKLTGTKTKNSDLLDKLHKKIGQSSSVTNGTHINGTPFIEKLKVGKSEKSNLENLNHGLHVIKEKIGNVAIRLQYDPP